LLPTHLLSNVPTNSRIQMYVQD